MGVNNGSQRKKVGYKAVSDFGRDVLVQKTKVIDNQNRTLTLFTRLKLTRLPSKQHLRRQWIRKPQTCRESTCTISSVIHLYEILVYSFLNILTLLICTQSVDNLLRSFMFLRE